MLCSVSALSWRMAGRRGASVYVRWCRLPVRILLLSYKQCRGPGSVPRSLPCAFILWFFYCGTGVGIYNYVEKNGGLGLCVSCIELNIYTCNNDCMLFLDLTVSLLYRYVPVSYEACSVCLHYASFVIEYDVHGRSSGCLFPAKWWVHSWDNDSRSLPYVL